MLLAPLRFGLLHVGFYRSVNLSATGLPRYHRRFFLLLSLKDVVQHSIENEIANFRAVVQLGDRPDVTKVGSRTNAV